MILLPWDDYLSPGLFFLQCFKAVLLDQVFVLPCKGLKEPYVPIPGKRVVGDLHGLIKKHRPALIHLVDNASARHCESDFRKSLGLCRGNGFARMTHPLQTLIFA